MEINSFNHNYFKNCKSDSNNITQIYGTHTYKKISNNFNLSNKIEESKNILDEINIDNNPKNIRYSKTTYKIKLNGMLKKLINFF